MKKIPELMAPAGDFSCLDAAIKAGANAVYFGIKGLNMRAGARNFSISDLGKIRSVCSKAGVRAYLTLNTIFFDKDLPTLKRMINAAARNSIDAIIAWDLAAVGMARDAGLEVFLSTQASVANAQAIARFNRSFGIRRFVLARECSLDGIKKMRSSLKKILGSDEASNIRIEVFAHGAMCVSESGRCFLSEFSCGKSANRGVCVQPCRREYLISDPSDSRFSYRLGSNYVLSPKDLCTLPFLDKLVLSGVDSLKIEGRSRNAEYVYETVKAYRAALNFISENLGKKDFESKYAAFQIPLMESLRDVFNRDFSDGFYFGRPIKDWTSRGVQTRKRKIILGHVLKYYPRISVAEISIDNSRLNSGDEIQLEGPQTGFMRIKADSFFIDSAPAKCANKGDIITIKTPSPVRKADRLFRF